MMILMVTRNDWDVFLNPTGKRAMRQVDVADGSQCAHDLHRYEPSPKDLVWANGEDQTCQGEHQEGLSLNATTALGKERIETPHPEHQSDRQRPASLVSESFNIFA